MKRYAASLTLMLILFIQSGLTQAAPISTGSLVQEMIDLHRFTDYPDPAFKTLQFSSYDHRSTHPGGPGWFDNSDGFGKEPIPNFEQIIKQPDENGIGEYLVCDVKGPGAIVRLWTAAITGTIRLYLDTSDTPVYDGPANDFFLKTYSSFLLDSGLDDTIFQNAFAQRNACYFPIPFAKRCRIVWIGDPKTIHFYQLQVRLYDKSASVRTFNPGDLKTYSQDYLTTSQVLKDPNAQWQPTSKEAPITIASTIKPEEHKTILSLDGPKAIERLTLRLQAADMDKALRQSVLRISFDGYPWGQVESPLGDLFGAAPGINPMNMLPFTVQPDGTMICRFVMPFKSKAVISIINRGDQNVTISGDVLLGDYSWNDETSMHFRARWRINHDLVASGAQPQDLPFIIANGGKGVFVGASSILLNPNDVPSSGGNWWGEGDEKIFVDGEHNPSTFGTGSEDYYNYAWSARDIFVFPYFSQPRNDGPANRGFVTNNRWQILDPLPFNNHLSFYMELFSHETTPNVSYARIGYYYASPGVMDDHIIITNEDVRHLELPKNWQPAARGAAKNSVFYQTEDLISAKKSRLIADNLWSGGKLFVWKPKTGDQLTIPFPIEEDGKYTIRIAHRFSPSSGRISATVDGNPNGFGGEAGVLDFHVPYRTLLRVASGHNIELTKGIHQLTLTSQGQSDASHGQEIGLDFIWIQRSN